MSGLRDYSPGTRAALQTFSRGACYYPGCGEPVVKPAGEEYYINYEIAHIRGAKEKGPRHDSDMPEEERKALPNLLLLCLVHHKLVDGKRQHEYPPEMLLKWKSDREAKGQDALAGLTRLTEEDLEKVIIDAFMAKQEQIMETLERLEEKDAEAANVMRSLLDELDQMRMYGPFLDPDSVVILSEASSSLTHLGENAEMLLSAADNLKGLNDISDTLESAQTTISDLTASLNSAAARLEEQRGQDWL